ncbi:helix-turn-helix transcriptional regulator [Agromyces albus]|uniref:helix-turn-helix transcriptional regulator n=1 Tax=Agromyces albus TaxID=205332 RepID=UPI002781EC68|nr:YafY family protein [Agromyces albus]MDQ0575079.1 putative DNA-binding transcriptional regulator YafY [Agromyces albus]
MRADRLVATLLLMQARGKVTAAELAEELEISVATARRDLEALSAAGIPVYPQAGRGGGWQLLGGARTDLSGLTSAEARALFLIVGPAASVAPEAKSALRKLVRALPDTFRAEAEAAAEAVVIDPAQWGRPPREQPEIVKLLQAAVVQRRRVRLLYRGWDREPVERLVDPWGLVEKHEVWYLLGGVAGAERTYRVDRIVEAIVVDEAAQRPADFDLAEAWERVMHEVNEHRERASAVVITDTAILPFLRERFGERSMSAESVDEHRTRIRVTAPTESLLARSLAGWADHLEVVEPESVRVELKRLGSELVRRN